MSSMLVTETSPTVSNPCVPAREIPEALASFFDSTHWKLFFEAFVPFQYKAFQDRGAFKADSRSSQPFESVCVDRELVADNAIVLLNNFCSAPPVDLKAMRELGRKLGQIDGFGDLLDSSKVYQVESGQIGSAEQKGRIAAIIESKDGLAAVLERDERRHHDRWLENRCELEAAAAARGDSLPPHSGAQLFDKLDDHQRWVSKCQTLMNCVTLARLNDSAFALLKSAAERGAKDSTLTMPAALKA